MTSKFLPSYFSFIFSTSPVYGQKAMQADLRESRLVLPNFLGGNPGVLVPVIEFFVGFVM